MAALLTSEMEKTEKIVQYMDECRAMGLTVGPPDVNRSGVAFTVTDGTMRFGLAAVKNVGAAAIESIVGVRDAGGSFRSLDDFMGRVDLRLLNRRVVESLIKAGAFDTLGMTRAGLLAGLDQALEVGQKQQRDREQGQASLFDALTPPDSAPAVRNGGSAGAISGPPQMDEWPADQLLAYEKEVLGFYLSGHPMERFTAAARRLGTLGAADLAGRSVGARVALLGQISGLRERATKSGNRMAFATLEAVDGPVALTVFPEALRTCGPALRSTGPVMVKGRVDDTDKGRVVLVEEASAVDEAALEAAAAPQAPPARACRLLVPGGAEGGDATALMAALAGLCRSHRGPTPVFLHVLVDGQEVVVALPGHAIRASEAFVAEAEALVGAGRVQVEHAGGA